MKRRLERAIAICMARSFGFWFPAIGGALGFRARLWAIQQFVVAFVWQRGLE